MKTRFCPSPTGLIHLGNARTAFFNYLAAQAAAGVFLLRIEDTDQTRSKNEYVDALKRDLTWLGATWQEGPDVGGDNGPYWQSQRQAIYDDYYAKLQAQGQAYPCFCSEEQLALARKVQRSQGQAPRYAGTCRNLTEAEVAEKVAQGLKPTLRFKIPSDAVIEFDDMVRGKQRFKSSDIGDFIIRRADGSASFMFCNAIDDALMGVSLALRGEDHLTNTPRQLWILQALGLTAPQYGHISLIVGQDGSPLSKRHGSKSLQELAELGYLPDAMANYLARLGHTYSNPDFMNLEELCHEFKPAALGKAPARYDENQLLFWQKTAVARLDAEAFKAWLGEAILSQVPSDKEALFLETIKTCITFPSDAQHWLAIFFGGALTFTEEQTSLIQTAGQAFFAEAIQAINTHGCDYAALTAQLKSALGVKGKQLFQPLRLALTAEPHGPELATVLTLLGKERVLERFEHAANL